MKTKVISRVILFVPIVSFFFASNASAQSQFKAEAVGRGWTCAQMMTINRNSPEAELVCQVCRKENGTGDVQQGFEWCPDPDSSGSSSSGGGCPPQGCDG